MTGLQEAFYIMGIVFMSLIFLAIIAIVIAVFRIKAKINKIHDNIEHKINSVTSVAEKGGELAAKMAATATRATRKAAKKTKR